MGPLDIYSVRGLLDLFNLFNGAAQNGLKAPVLLPHLPYAGDGRHTPPLTIGEAAVLLL